MSSSDAPNVDFRQIAKMMMWLVIQQIVGFKYEPELTNLSANEAQVSTQYSLAESREDR